MFAQFGEFLWGFSIIYNNHNSLHSVNSFSKVLLYKSMYDTLHKVINKLKHLEMHELIHVMEKYCTCICKKTIDFYW